MSRDLQSRRDRSSPPSQHRGRPPRRGARPRLDHRGRRRAVASSTPPVAPSWSTSGMAEPRSPRPWRTRPVGSRMPMARPSRPSRSRPTPPRSGRTCPSTSRRSTPSVVARRRWRPRSRWRVPTTLARGESDRWIVVGPLGQLSRQHARRPRPLRPPASSAPVRGLARPVPTRQRRVPLSRRRTRAPRRSGPPRTPRDRAGAGASLAGPGTVAAFVAEPIVGATLAAAEPPDGYWPAIAEVFAATACCSSPTR